MLYKDGEIKHIIKDLRASFREKQEETGKQRTKVIAIKKKKKKEWDVAPMAIHFLKNCFNTTKMKKFETDIHIPTFNATSLS